jgi:hypothetical protein
MPRGDKSKYTEKQKRQKPSTSKRATKRSECSQSLTARSKRPHVKVEPGVEQ